jgi:hypothetical protein
MRIVPSIRIPVAVVGAALSVAAPAVAQEEDLVYDDGRASGGLTRLAAGDVEVTRMTPEHPARLLAVRLYFLEAGCTAHVAVWPDNGGNAPDLENPLWETDAAVEAAGWLDVPVPDGAAVFDPPAHFYVGHVAAGDPFCRAAWDASGSAESRSLARLDGSVYAIIDGSDPPRYLDALIRARVTYFDVRTEWDFVDVSDAAGIPRSLRRVAWGDYDGDGDDDLLGDGRRLFRNEGDGTFTEVTEAAGIGDAPAGGGVWADFDNDGDPDFYATVSSYLPACDDDGDCVWCTLRSLADGSRECDAMQHDHTCVEGTCMPPSGERPHDVLWRNEGDGTFTDVSDAAGAPYDYLPTQAAAWGDYDRDGFVDLYAANYETPGQWVGGRLSIGTYDRLWRNNGDGTFADVTEAAGISAARRCGYGVSWADFDEDGDPDVHVANYRLQADFLWENRGGIFAETAAAHGVAGYPVASNYGHSIGAAWGDLDLDGDWDVFVANLAHPRFLAFSDKSMLYANGGPPDWRFENRREGSGITYSETHSNPALADVDNDGDEDMFLTDVYVGYRSFLYWNDGDLSFTDVTYPSGIRVDNGWGAAWADFDHDGRPDLAASGLWANRTRGTGRWLDVRLRGTDSNASAIGAVVEVTAGGRRMRRQVEGGSGTGVQNSATLHFGLGAAERADRVEVRWPSGLVEAREDLEANRTIDWREGETPAGEAGDGEEDGGADDVATDGADAGDAGPSPPSSGCGCRLARPAGAHGLLWFGVAFLAGAVRRRRR